MPLPALAQALLTGKPYFGPALRAMQGVPERHGYFLPAVRAVAASRPGKELDVLEIGSWAGASTVSWAVALREAGCGGKITCVDSWSPYFDPAKDDTGHYRDMNDAARDGLIVQLFHHNIRTSGFADMIEVHRGTSEAVLPGFGSGRFDIVYIDGSHRFDDVCFDICEAKRLVRGNGVICGDDLELQAAEIDHAELQEAVSGGQDYVVPVGGRSGYHPGVTAAVAAEFHSVGVWQGFWAVTRSNDQWIAAALELADLHLPDHIAARAGICKVVDTTPTHNLVEADGQFFAIDKSLGPMELFLERVGERELPPLLLQASSLEEIRMKAAERPSSHAPAYGTGPELIGSYRGFNLVACNDRIYAARQALGPVDLRGEEREMEVRLGSENFVAAASVELAKLQVDAIEANHDISALADTMKCIRAMAESEREAQSRQFAELRALLQSGMDTLSTEAAAWRAAIQEYREEHKNDLIVLRSSVQAELKDVQADSVDIRRKFDELLEAQRCDLDRLSATFGHLEVGMRADLEDLKASLHNASREHQVLAHEFALMRCGPGNPDSPCLAGEYRGFALAHFRKRVYGLRSPIDVQELFSTEYDLQIHYGPEDVVIGDSVDGVRARIDVIEHIRDLRAELAAFDKQLRHGALHIDEVLHKVDEAIEIQDRRLQELARSRPTRLRKLFTR